MVELTKEQQRIIDERASNLLVSASAGSGKTHTMIARIIDIIKNKEASIKEMMVATFTNAAASEMRQKIYEALESAAKEDFMFEEQIDELVTSDIFTLHNFCSKLIKQNFFEVGVDPAFKILNTSESSVLMSSSLQSILNKYINAGDVVFNELYETYNKKRKDANLKESIISVYSFLKSKYEYENWVLEIVNSTYSESLKDNLAAEFIRRELLEKVTHFIKVFNRLNIEACHLESEKLISITTGVLEFLKTIDKTRTFEELFIVMSNTPSIRIGGKYEGEAKELKDKIKKQKDLVMGSKPKAIVKSFFESCGGNNLEEIKTNLTESKKLLLKLLEIVKVFDKHYLKVKKDKGMLDFNDLEHYALKILKNDTIAKAIRESYKYIFIDEYQDTNQIQEEIIRRISGEDNCFMVGDVKQSIYMFRQCDPQIFVDKYNSFKEDNIKNIKIDLNKNFRSTKTVLDFSNFVFNNIMKVSTASIDYINTASFVAGADYKNNVSNIPLVSVDIINKVKKEEEEIADSLKVYSVENHINAEEEENYAKLEARLVALKIKNFIGTKIYDAKNKCEREVEFSDIAILTRVRGDFIKTVTKELDEHNIPVLAKYKFKVFETYEAILINNYLKLINNQNDDVALASVLSSFMFNLSYSDLAKIRLNNKSKFFYECVSKYITENQNNGISTKVKKLFEDLNTFRQKNNYLNVAELIKEILAKYNIKNYLLALPNGKERLENVNSIISVASRPEVNNDLFKYVNYMETFGCIEEFDVKTASGANSVTVTTIHNSKGLEYPIVILIGAGRDFANISLKQEVLINKELGFGVNYYNLQNRIKHKTLAKGSIKLAIKQQELAEEMRLLYVAVTRAKNHLVVVGKTDLQNREIVDSDYLIKQSKNYLSWIMGSLKSQDLNSLKLGNKNITIKLDKNTSCEFNVYLPEDFLQDKKQVKTKALTLQNEIFKNQFEKIFNSKYPYDNTKDILVKSSVSEIMQQSEETNYNYSIEKFKVNEVNSTKQDIDFSLIGTVYHLAMQYLPLTLETTEQVVKELGILIKNGTMPKEALELLEADKLLKAIKAIAKIAEGADSILKEKQFMMYIPYKNLFEDSKVEDKILVQGVVDLIIIKNNKAIVLDYKTSRISSAEKLLKKYNTQLNLYKMATEKAIGIKVDQKLIYSFYLDTIVND